MKHAANAKAWALGKQQRNGFHVRRVVWGRLMARMERRKGEEIRAAIILVGEERKAPPRALRDDKLDKEAWCGWALMQSEKKR